MAPKKKPGIAARASKVSKFYGEGEARIAALDNVSVEIEKGRLTAIMGPSGSGKSTLMHVMAGLDTVSKGTVWLGRVNMSALKEKELTKLRRDKIGFVFQSFNLIPTLTAIENITLPTEIAGAKPDQDWVDQIVAKVGLTDRLTHRPSELSGGQQQRVAVARALASHPEIVFADEPTGNLDSKSGSEVLGLLRSSVDELGQTIVMVTHDAPSAAYADRVVFLADGQVTAELNSPTVDQILRKIKAPTRK
ncbi:MAG: ABC transporter ATP-binding protein [Actinobacteria bacterium]|jgi:putative ABC transport system ATP-binding protein|nr:ABC transporter ATP-binding protein [Actinomycetota bacterium]